MTKTIYLMRHGETLFNRQRRIQGWCDSPLTANGRAQATQAAAYFRDAHVHLDAAYCSTAERASDTLALITDLPYTRLKGLRERGFGEFEGQPEYLNPPRPYGDFFAPYGGETDEQVDARITAAVQSIVETDPGQNILIVSHAGATMTFMHHWANLGFENRLHNCDIAQFSYADGVFKLVQIIHPLH